jgi:flagellar protein FlbB
MARTFLLLLLILAVIAGGLVWFDYLGVIDIKTTVAPVYNFFGLQGRTQSPAAAGEFINLDAERLAVRLETLALRELEMEKERTDIERQRVENEQVAAELETRQKGLEEQEQSLGSSADLAAARDRNIEQVARNLNGMAPQDAVNRIVAMDDQMAIDVMNKTEAIARAEGTTSIVSFWFSLMPPDRAAELMRKMTERP